MNNYLTIGFFNENNLELIKTQIVDNKTINNKTSSDTLQVHKNILLRDEISILSYRLGNISSYIFLLLKNIIYDNKISTFEIENYLIAIDLFQHL